MPDTKTISVKIPTRILDQMPAPGNGRSKFIVQAIEDKIAVRSPSQWKPKTERGRRMAALIKEGRIERIPVLSITQMEQEIKERRGRNF